LLAINGGKAVRTKEYPVKWPIWDEKTLEQLKDVLESGRWAISGAWTGRMSKCMQFEQAYAKYNHCNYAVTTTNGSASLVIALEALGIGPGDEVIVPALTWGATAIAVCEVNAIPIMVDVEPDTYCMSIPCVEKAITKKTRAIIPVHLYGCMVEMDELRMLAKKHNLHIIEDASHSHGSIWGNEYAGTMGEIGAFSLQQGKVLTSGEGGVAVTNSKDLYEKMIELRSNARTYIQKERLQMNKMELIEAGNIMGTNYCLSEFQAAILLDQLNRLEQFNIIKEKNAIYLNENLSKIPGIKVMRRHEKVTRQAYYRYAIRIDSNCFDGKSVGSICKALEAELGFTVEQPYTPMHKSALYCPLTKRKYKWSKEQEEALDVSRYSLPVAEKAAKNEGVIFHHSYLLGGLKEMDEIIEAFQKVNQYANEIKE